MVTQLDLITGEKICSDTKFSIASADHGQRHRIPTEILLIGDKQLDVSKEIVAAVVSRSHYPSDDALCGRGPETASASSLPHTYIRQPHSRLHGEVGDDAILTGRIEG